MVVILREVIEMDFTTLQKAMIDAMKARDKARKDSIAVLVSAAKKLAIDSGCREDIPDEMVDQAILKEIKSIMEQIRSWWEVTDRESAFEIVDWLLREGHHAEADRVLAAMRNGQETEDIDEDKVEDVSLITDYMLENSICDMNSVPHTAIAWDLVRIVNLGRWAFQCGYITEEDMWNIMCVADETASANFSSWEEYGMSFVLGRGVWHGDTDDCQTAYEIVAELLKNEDSPWLQLSWSD